MLDKLFWKDPYMQQCEACVTRVDGDIVNLDKTIAFAFSGGQESDYGTIGGFSIKESFKNGLDIDYLLENHDLSVGDKVLVAIDFDRRYKMMRLHFCGDMVLQIILTKYPNIIRIGAHVSADKVRMDFEFDQNISCMFEWLAAELKDIVARDYVITKGFKDESTQLRYWKIDDYDAAECGGTHVNSTKEIGEVKFKRKNLGAGKERIEIYLV